MANGELAKVIPMPPYDLDILVPRAKAALTARGYTDLTDTLIYGEIKRQRTLQLREWRDNYGDRLQGSDGEGTGSVVVEEVTRAGGAQDSGNRLPEPPSANTE